MGSTFENQQKYGSSSKNTARQTGLHQYHHGGRTLKQNEFPLLENEVQLLLICENE